jgi:hypothetical protein
MEERIKMDLDKLMFIKQVGQCTGIDKDILGAALMYNILYKNVTDNHRYNFKVAMYSLVKRKQRELKGEERKQINDIQIDTTDEAWAALNVPEPLKEDQRMSEIIRRYSPEPLPNKNVFEYEIEEKQPEQKSLVRKLLNKVGIWI